MIAVLQDVSTKTEYGQLIDLVKDFISYNTNIVFTKELNANGVYIPTNIPDEILSKEQKKHNVKLEKNNIYINIARVNKVNLADVVIEEILHSVTVNELSKYIASSKISPKFDDKKNKVSLNIPAYDANKIPAEIRSNIIDLITLYKNTLDKLADKVGHKELYNLIHSGNSRYYPLTNFTEFVAGMYSNTEFKNEIKDISVNQKDFLTKFVESVKALMQFVFKSSNNSALTAGNSLLYEFLSRTNQKEVIQKSNPIDKVAELKTKVNQNIQKNTNPFVSLLNKSEFEIMEELVKEYQNIPQATKNEFGIKSVQKLKDIYEEDSTDTIMTKILDHILNQDIPYNNVGISQKDINFVETEKFKKWIADNNLLELYSSDPQGIIDTYNTKCK